MPSDTIEINLRIRSVITFINRTIIRRIFGIIDWKRRELKFERISLNSQLFGNVLFRHEQCLELQYYTTQITRLSFDVLRSTGMKMENVTEKPFHTSKENSNAADRKSRL